MGGGGHFKRVIGLIKEKHGRMPHLGILSWDITLDENANPVIIEINTTGQSAWFCQMVNGEPLFGDNTADMLKLINQNNREYNFFHWRTFWWGSGESNL